MNAICDPASAGLSAVQAGVHHVVDCGKDAFNLATANWGKTQMRPRSVLVDPSNHFLENDRLAVRISIRVKPPGPVAGGAAAVADGNASDEDEGGVAVVGL